MDRAPRLAAVTKVMTPVTKWFSRISNTLVEESRARRPASTIQIHPFVRANHPASVFPKGFNTLAMDEDINQSLAWAQSAIPAALEEGLGFLGYPYLTEIAQRAEYRRMVEIIALEMTRKWIKLQTKGDEDKTDRINELKDAMTSLNVQGVFREAAEHDGFFGRGHIYLDTGSTDDPDELKTPIGDGKSALSAAKVKKGSLKMLKTVEAVWCYPSRYNSNDPLKPDWYKPNEWFVQGKQLDASRLLTFIGREVPDLLKPAYSFGGLSLTQMAKPYVDNWLRTRQSVSDLLHSFSTFILETDLGAILAEGSSELWKRVELFNNLRDNRGLMVINKDSEGFQNVSAPLGGLHELQSQAQEQMCSVHGIPLLKFTGIAPAGLNASTEGEMRSFYDWVHSYQETLFTKNLTRVMHFVMLHLWGEVDLDITFEYEPLWSLDDLSLSNKRKSDADIDNTYLQAEVISKEEVRARIAADPDSPYQGIDVEDLPIPEASPDDLEGEEPIAGLEGAEGGPGGGKATPDDEEGAARPPTKPAGSPKVDPSSKPAKPTKISKPAPEAKPERKLSKPAKPQQVGSKEEPVE